MKKLIILIVGVAVLAILGKVAYNKIQNKGKSDDNLLVYDLQIKDTASLDKIIITEPSGRVLEIVRKGKKWESSKGDCLNQELAQNILDAAYNIKLKGYIAENGIKPNYDRIAVQGIKAEFFSNGDWVKTWWVGGPTADHLGTFILVHSAENGESDIPVVAELTNMKGFITPRFTADQKAWSCTELIQYNPQEIAEVQIQNLEMPNESFTVKGGNGSYSLSQNGKQFPVKNADILKYLTEFRKVNFLSQNYDLTDRQIDSMNRTSPFCKMTIKTKKGRLQTLKLYRMKGSRESVDDFGKTVSYDINNLWCVRETGELVKCQYFVMNKLIYAGLYFR